MNSRKVPWLVLLLVAGAFGVIFIDASLVQRAAPVHIQFKKDSNDIETDASPRAKGRYDLYYNQVNFHRVTFPSAIVRPDTNTLPHRE